MASNDPSLIEGAHAESLLYIFDESKSIPADIFDAAEGAFSGPGETFALACSTPGAPAGRFYDFHARRPGLEDWHPKHITLDQAINAGRISKSWAEKRAKQWGEESALYKNRVKGEFATGDADGVIPLPWVEAAIERWTAIHDETPDFGPATSIGVDVAREGADRTCIALKHGDVFSPLRLYSRGDTMQTAGRVAAILRAHPNATAVIDIIGIGAGVFDRLREQDLKPRPFGASAKADGKDRSGELGFFNLRAEAWWRLREALDPAFGATLALPPDDEDLLLSDLTTPHYTETSRGLIQVEKKEEIKKRLGRSTDSADAVVMAHYESNVLTQGAGFMALMKAKIAADFDPQKTKAILRGEDPDAPVPPPTGADWPLGECELEGCCRELLERDDEEIWCSKCERGRPLTKKEMH